MTKEELLLGLLALGVPEGTAKSFISWGSENQEIWREFESLALEAINRGVNKWGAKSIAEIVRWNLRLKGYHDYKLNNNYPAYLARAFSIKHPHLSYFFEYRKAKGLKNAA